MTKFIFVRHGQSKGNLKKVFLGHTDADLTEVGYKQAELAADYLASSYKIDKIYSSDLCRAHNTAKAVANRIGVEVIDEPALREIYAGEWENKTFDRLQCEYRDDYNMWLTDIGNCTCTGGESPKDVLNRVLPKLCEIAADNPEKTVLIATHAAVIRCLECVWRGVELSEMKNIPWVTNASASVLNFDGSIWKAEVIGDDSYLGEMASGLPANV